MGVGGGGRPKWGWTDEVRGVCVKEGRRVAEDRVRWRGWIECV